MSDHCFNCQEALAVASSARAIADLDVEVITLDQSDRQIPAVVFAVPTYLLDGKVISRGNPRPSEFLAWLAAAVEDRQR